MTANEIPVGSGFLGSISDGDWRTNWKPGKPIDGAVISVTVIRPGTPDSPCGENYLRELLRLHTGHLPSESQLSNRRDKWVVGVRDSRSKKVRLFEWDVPRGESFLEEISGHVDMDRWARVRERLDYLKGKEVPFL